MATRKLRTEFQRSFILFPLIPLLILGAVIVVFYYHSLKANILSANSKTTDMLTHMLAEKISQSETKLQTMSVILEKQYANDELATDIINSYFSHAGYMKEIRLADHEGYIRVIVPENRDVTGTDMSGELFVREAKRTGEPAWSRSHLSLDDDTPVSSLAIPYANGILIGYFDFRSLSTLLDTFARSSEGIISVIDQSGTYLYHPDSDKVAQRQWETRSVELRSLFGETLDESSAFIETDKELITGSKIGSTGWIIAIHQDKKAITAPILRLSIILFWGCLIFAGIGFLFSLRTSAHYFNYFQRLAGRIHDVADGRYDQDVPTEGYSELQQIERDFNRMTQQIMSREGKINTLNMQLKKQLDEANTAIRQRKEAEEDLRKTYETMVTVLDAVESTIHVTDLESHEIIFANRYMKELYGDELVGQYCWDIIRCGQQPCENCRKSELLDENGQPTAGYAIQEKDHITGRWVINHNRTIRWVDGRFVHIRISTDITRLKEVEEKLRQSQKLEAIGTLAGGVAHDFNNILAAILGYAELAKEEIGPGQEELATDLEEILQGAERASELVRQILAFSRQGGKEQQPLKLQEIINEALKLLRPSIPTTIDITTDVDDNCPEILANPTELHQVIMNICTNGYQAMRETGGMLNIALASARIEEDDKIGVPPLPTGQYVQLTISDTGHGIDSKLIGKIFDPYFTSKPQGEGTGLGLAVVHGIITKYGGTITVESEIGTGTVFKVYLPIHDSGNNEDFTIQTAQLPLPTGFESILIVDDDEAIGKVAAKSLSRLGYRTTVFSSSVEALLEFSNLPDAFDLVITDMTMPEMTGAKMAESILAIRPGLPIILCTGFSDIIDEDAAKNIGIRSFLMKPTSMETLATTVRVALDGK